MIDETRRNAQIVWDYMLMHQKIEKSDAIFVLGSHDMSVATYAADLYKKGWSPLLIFSGGFGTRATEHYEVSEAERFAEIAVSEGVPAECILMENKSKNTGENVLFTAKLLEKKGIIVNKVIAVQKPYMERRTFATVRNFWPAVDVIVTSMPVSMAEYSNIVPEDRFINAMVGDLFRIKHYAEIGYQIYQEIPPEVWEANKKLISMGYSKTLPKELKSKQIK